MQSRRDQVQAQSYVLGRLTSALVAGEPDGLENPSRRTVVGTVSGVLIAAIVVVGFAAYGFFRPGGASSWQQPGVLVVEKETGSRFLYAQGRLWPVLNYSSVRMKLGTDPKVVSVSAESLAGVPQGRPVGIVGAPDALPAAGSLAGVPWTVCDLGQTVTLAVRPSAAEPAGAGEAMVVRAGDDSYLLMDGQRRKLTASWTARVLGFDSTPPEVQPAWLDLIPAGADVAVPAIPGRGTPGPAVEGVQSKIGQLYVARVTGVPDRYYVMLADGLSPLTATGYAIMAGDPGAPAQPAELGPAALAQAPVSTAPVLFADLPATPPRPVNSAAAWCARWTPDGGFDLVAGSPLGAADTVRDSVAVTRTTQTAAAIRVRAGAGGLVRAARAGDAPGGSLFLLTDAGVKYPLGGPAVATALGYPDGTAAPVPPELLDILPTGPLLDPAQVWG